MESTANKVEKIINQYPRKVYLDPKSKRNCMSNRTFKEFKSWNAQTEIEEMFPAYVRGDVFSIAVSTLEKLQNGDLQIKNIQAIMGYLKA